MRVAISAAPLLLALTVAAQSTEWPTYMHDNTRAGSTTARLPRKVVEQWTIRSPVAPQRAWPGPGDRTIENLKLRPRVRFDEVFHVAISGGSVFFGSSVDNCVRSVDLRTGTERWRFVTGGAVRLAPTVWKNRVYFGSDDGFAYCLDHRTGRVIWKLRAGPRDERILARGHLTSRWPVRTSVLIDDGIAYFGAGTFPHENVYLHAVDARTGKSIWADDAISQRQAGRNDLTPQGYLLASSTHLFVPSGRTLPAAIDKASGRLVHKQPGGGKQVGGSQALLADDKVMSMGEHYILALDQAKGGIVSKLRGRQMTLSGQRAYISADGQLISVDRVRYVEANRRKHKRAKQAAKLRKKLGKHPHLAARAALARARAAGADRDELRKLARQVADTKNDYEAKKTELERLVGILWRAPCKHDSALILAGDTLVVGGVDQVVGYSAKTGERLWSHAVHGEARGLAVAERHLVVSTSKGDIVSFGAGNPSVITPPPDPFAADEPGGLWGRRAQNILDTAGIRRGYCLVIGAGNGRFAYELAKRSELTIVCADSSTERVAAARDALVATGLYGSRITVDHLDLALLPYPSYFANLVVSADLFDGGKVGADPEQVARLVKPIGGVVCLVSDAAGASARIQSWTDAIGLLAEGGKRETKGATTLLRRGVLPGAAEWSHLYGNTGATASIEDTRVKGGLSVLWYGDPGPSKMLNRHVGAVGPLCVNGRLFVQGEKTISAWDAYNGLFLWERENPGVLRTGVFRNYEPGDLAADGDSLFMVVEDRCERFDAATGKLVRTYRIPASAAQSGHTWGYVAVSDGILFGTSTRRDLLPENKRGRGRTFKKAASNLVFAYDIATGKELWRYQGKTISHTTVAIDGGRVIFVDSSLTPAQREAMLKQDKSKLEKLTGKARKAAEKQLKRIDLRLAVALDAKTGKQLWAEPVDVTDCTGVGIGAGRLMLMAHEGHVVLAGANANGHYWKQFLKGDFSRRRLVVLSAIDGHKVWAKDANYRHRPIIVRDQIIAEPWAYEIDSGELVTRIHPLTGLATPWIFPRPGHHCGMVVATPAMMFFRSKFTAYYDRTLDSGTRHFAGHRLGCWINAIPADGLVLVPEASAGCACLFSLTSTIVFEPRVRPNVWGVYGAVGAKTPVRHMALNLGAPGDRRDRAGKLWLGYPRPSSRPGIDLSFSLKQRVARGGGFYSKNAESFAVEGAAVPWVHASGVIGMTRCELPLLSQGQDPATYTVRLMFVTEPDERRGQRVFDVKLQGRTVLADFEARDRKHRRAVIKEFKKIPVTERLVIELVPKHQKSTAAQLPRLCGIEVLRTGATEIEKHQ